MKMTPFRRAFMVGLGLVCGVAVAGTFSLFSPATGILKGNSSTYITTAAGASDIAATYTGQSGCSGSAALLFSGVCGALGTGSVTSVSVVTANGLSGTVATSTTTPAITLAPTFTGITYSNGTGFAAAIAANFPTLNQTTTGTAAGVTGGLINQILVQSGASATTFLAAPTTSGTALEWNGSAFVWVTPSGTGCAGANPTAAVGLTAVNGSASSCIRSDGAPALSQAIAPTWTGNHIFTPSSGVAIAANVSGANTAGVFVSNSTAGGVEYTLCGTSNTSGARCWVERVGSTGTFTLQAADDSGVPQGTAFQLGRDTSGNFTTAAFAAPGSGTNPTLTITGSTTGSVLVLNGGNATNSYTRYQTAGTTFAFIGDAFSVFAANTGDLGIGGGGKAIHIGATSSAIDIATSNVVTFNAAIKTLDVVDTGTCGTATVSAVTVTQADLCGGNQGLLGQVNGGAGTDLKAWQTYADASGILHFATVNDALSVSNDWLNLARTLAVVTQANFKEPINFPGASAEVDIKIGGWAAISYDGSTGLQLGGTVASQFLSTGIYSNGVRSALFSGGLQMGAPTGGDEGAGTINVSSGYFLNGAALAAPLTAFATGTTRTSTTTQSCDASITLPAVNAAKYAVHAWIDFAGNGITANGYKVGFGGTNISIANSVGQATVNTSTANVAPLANTTLASGQFTKTFTNAGTDEIVQLDSIATTTSTSTSVCINWAQNTTSGTATNNNNSYITAVRVQ